MKKVKTMKELFVKDLTRIQGGQGSSTETCEPPQAGGPLTTTACCEEKNDCCPPVE